jgi:hypothetical protein
LFIAGFMPDDELNWLIDELCKLLENCSSRLVVWLFISGEIQADTFPDKIFLVLVENDCWIVVAC